jgi:uncharacterized protein YggE
MGMYRTGSVFMVGLLALAGCQKDRGGEPFVVQMMAPAAGGDGQPLAIPAGRTITVSGTAEILTAPDRFEVVVAFDVQTATLDAARDEGRKRAAALLDVVNAHAIPACDVQTDQLSLQPRYEGGYQAQRLIGYQATRSLTLTLRDVDKVEGLLFDMLAAGANRVDRVSFHSSALQEKRAEARVLAVTAARVKAEAMAAALGQTLGEPLRIEEDGPQSAWQAPAIGNYVMNNDSAAHVGETMATGKIRVNAGVSVVFRLQGA